MAYEVGQRLIRRDHYRGGRRESEVEVTRVGRKYVYAAHLWNGRVSYASAFDIETGWEKASSAVRARIATAEEWVEIDREAEVRQRTRELLRSFRLDEATVEELEAVSAIIEGVKARLGRA